MNRTFINFFVAISTVFALAVAAGAQSNPPAWNASTIYKVGDLASYVGNTFQCQINETSTNRPNPHTASWGAYFLYSGPSTIAVGPSETFKTLEAAWNYIKDARISANSSVTISFDANFTENIATSFSLDHPYGSQIHIVGNHKGQGINFNGSYGGLLIDNGNSIAELRGFKISLAKNIQGSKGIYVGDRAHLNSLTSVDIIGFDNGVVCDDGRINDLESLTFQGFGTNAVEAESGGSITVNGELRIDGSLATYSLSEPVGFYATEGGSIHCGSCIVSNCFVAFEAKDNGTLYADESTANGSDSGADGYYAINHSTILAFGATSNGFGYGFNATLDSFINAERGTANGYLTCGYNAVYGSKVGAVNNQGGSTNSDSTSLILLEE
ncbi:MAG TPA: carbohydrate-binding protein [Fimbriimonadaceae bacterium]